MENQDKPFITMILSLIAIGLAFDVWNDWSAGAAYYHVWLEALIVCFSAFGIFWIWRDNSLLRRKVSGTHKELELSKLESEKWRREHQALVQGLGAAIDRQLISWALSKAEREVAVLLLKGYSFKEIADLRNGSEKTVRQHSLRIYERSNLAGRAELSAFFLEDLLGPIDQSTNSTRKPSL